MITVGITELHGIASELMAHPPQGISYSEAFPSKHFTNHFITSSAKGVLRYFDDATVDLLEAPLFPIITKKNWIYTPADLDTFLNFSLLGMPLPRFFRLQFIRHLFKKQNLIRLLFKSEAGLKTFTSNKLMRDDNLLSKTEVVYPAVRNVPDSLIKYNTHTINILFCGEFLGKGGVHVLNAFEQIQKESPQVRLRFCSPIAFKTNNASLESHYRDRIVSNHSISFGPVNRKELMDKIFPDSDIFVCPTYKDSYGYSIEEAMAYGLPVISTDHFAIPEMVKDGLNGFLIKTGQYDFIKSFKNYYVDYIPQAFLDYMNSEVYRRLKLLVADASLRKQMGIAGLAIARDKFSFAKRNEKMSEVYHKGVSTKTNARRQLMRQEG